MKYLQNLTLITAVLFCCHTIGLAQTSCINCHTELDDELKSPVDEMLKGGSHHKNEITCSGCHGGVDDVRFSEDAEAAMDPLKGYIGIPARKDIPRLCSRCHSSTEYMRKFNPNLPTDQYQQYLTSRHGQQLAKGDVKVALCTDCHGTHNIQPANSTASLVFPGNIPDMCGKCHSDPVLMNNYNLSVDQNELYQKSVHWKSIAEKGDRSAPVCNDCHGNHGAYPPGISSISHVCGTCHVIQAEMFSQSRHKDVFAEMDLPQCESCHGNHEVMATNVNMLGVGEGGVCVNCHDEGSDGYFVAAELKAMQDSLIHKIELADSLREKAEKAGVEVSDGEFKIKDARSVLTKARSAVHLFSAEKFNEVIRPGYEIADDAVTYGFEALREVQNRRKWLALISIIIFIAAISLYLKIKNMDSK